MPPNQHVPTGVLNETDVEVDTKCLTYDIKPREYRYAWEYIILLGSVHLLSVYSLYLMFTSAKILTTIQVFVLIEVAMLGTTCGTHRLWAHRCYKATTPLKILLIIMQTLAFQKSIICWSRDHRVHHKFTDTDADPHNSNRGFFFSHVGWLLVKKHPDVIKKGSGVDFSDLTGDPMLRFQHNYFIPLTILITFAIPTIIPMYFWNETFVNAFCLNVLRYCIGLNLTFLVNSAAHLYGTKPYDKFISPVEIVSVTLLTLGEGWHNFHHSFPWDYKTGEFGKYSTNLSTAFIDFFAKIGWAYDLKTVSEDMVRKKVQRTGDGSHPVWGWNDRDMSKGDIRGTIIINKTNKNF